MALKKRRLWMAFGLKNLQMTVKPQINEEIIDGKRYLVVEVRRVALIPQKLEPSLFLL